MGKRTNIEVLPAKSLFGSEVSTKVKRPKSLGRSALSFSLPGLIVFFLFAWYPLIVGFSVAFQHVHTWKEISFVGLQNFQTVLSDPLTWRAVKNTLYYTSLSLLLTFLLPILVAILLMEMRKNIIRIMMILWFIPASSMAGFMIWKWMYNPQYGLFNVVLERLGFSPLGWLNDPKLAMLCLVLPGLIMYGPGLVYIATLQGIPDQLYEAAELEGASFFTKIRYITLPRLRPIVAIFLMLAVIGNMSIFSGPFIMTGGGPANATLMLVMYVFRQAFTYWDFGVASALALLIFLLLLMLIIIQRKYFKENLDVCTSCK